ncbi:MAG: hypothetical protein ACK40G_06090 [Cytophagaceae bacterium]
MNPETILVIIIAILIIDFFSDIALDFINLNHQKKEVPEELKDVYTVDEFQKSHDYFKTNTRFGFITATFSFLIYLISITSGLFGWLDYTLRQSINHPILLSLSFFGILFLITDIINTPFTLYKTFVIEEKFGFNKSTIKTFLMDKLKGYLLGAIIGGIVISIFLILTTYLGQNFWIYFWIVISIFVILINMFYTSLLAASLMNGER